MAKKTSKEAAKNANAILDSLRSMETTSKGDMFSDFFGMMTKEEEREIKSIDKEKAVQEIEQNREGYMIIDVDRLVANPLSKFHMREDESWAAIKDMMQKHGFVQGFLVTGVAQSDGSVRLISGHRRTAIAKSLGISRIPVMLIDVSGEAEEIDLVLAANHNRGEAVTDLLKNYILCSEKYESGVWPDEEKKGYKTKRIFIATKMGYPESKIRNHEFLLAYDPAIWVMIDEKIFTVNEIRKIDSQNKKGNLINHDEVIKELMQEKDVLLDRSLPLEQRQKKATEILSHLKRKASPNKTKKPAEKILDEFAKTIKKREYIIPSDPKKKKAALKTVDELKKLLQGVENELKQEG